MHAYQHCKDRGDLAAVSTRHFTLAHPNSMQKAIPQLDALAVLTTTSTDYCPSLATPLQITHTARYHWIDLGNCKSSTSDG